MRISAAITGIERGIFQMGILDRNKVKLSYDVDVLPTLRCPASGRVILKPTPDGEPEEIIRYARNKSVLFSLLSPMIGTEELDYLRKDLRSAVKILRKSLGPDGADESTFDLLDGHFADWPGNIIVFEITLDGLHGQCQYIGIDMGSESLDDETDM